MSPGWQGQTQSHLTNLILLFMNLSDMNPPPEHLYIIMFMKNKQINKPAKAAAGNPQHHHKGLPWTFVAFSKRGYLTVIVIQSSCWRYGSPPKEKNKNNNQKSARNQK